MKHAILLLLLLLLPLTEARNDNWEVQGMDVGHHFPDVQVEIGATFWAGGEAHADGQPVDNVAWSDFNHSAGCTVLDFEFMNASGVSSWRVQFQMTGQSCTWTHLATGIDGGLIGGQDEAFVYVTGSLESYARNEIGGNPGAGLMEYWSPALFTLLAAGFAAWRGYKRGGVSALVWAFPAIIVLMMGWGVLLGFVPIGGQYAAYTSLLLFLYALAMFGFRNKNDTTETDV